MCGIAGFISPHGETAEELRHHAGRMSEAIAHRGPDGQGVWCDARHGVVLGHRRLAVVDLSPLGAQPMVSACGRYVVTFNGEIYNHLALRRALGPLPWRGHSDTETLLACFMRHGVHESLSHLVGMFAFAVWDTQRLTLTMARDRMGEKPVYYGRLPAGDFLFGSELKALRAHPRWQASIDRDALAMYMRHNTIPAPLSIYQGISKLQPGCWIDVAADGSVRHGEYWRIQDVAHIAREHPVRLDDVQATAQLRALLDDAVHDQMVADVPLGAFLSGGVDSSAIVASMRRQASTRVRTFTIGFTEKGFDEAIHARAVAQHLDTDHTELYIAPADALAVIPNLAAMYDEPFADSSQIPTYLVSRMTRGQVTVALSGDGGDELFAGYNRYLLADQTWRWLDKVPLALRRLAARSLLAAAPSTWDAVASTVSATLPRLRRYGAVGDKLHKFAADVMCAQSRIAMYRGLVSHWNDPTAIVLGASARTTLIDEPPPEGLSPIEHMCLLDQATYLPDDILVKVDRAAMRVSLETRVPLLDHRIVEFAWRLPLRQKIRDGTTKWLLRQVLYQDVPQALIERPKQGFAVPLGDWLRGALRPWAEALLDPTRIRREGFFEVTALRAKWDQHLRGERNWQFHLWDALMFQAWHEAEPAAAARDTSACGRTEARSEAAEAHRSCAT
jgi:asparagine synthase (glutamine-hydrolysing)